MREGIILAGGLGTRLRGVIGEIPKPIAPVRGHPFLYYILKQLEHFLFDKLHLSVGYNAQMIVDALAPYKFKMPLNFIFEDSPLGTGGAIKNALVATESDEVFVINGDTYFDIDLDVMNYDFHQNKPDILIAGKHIENCDRYGTILLNGSNAQAFHEKKPGQNGTINGGIYLMKTNIFDNVDVPDVFSFETFMTNQISNKAIDVISFDDRAFLDIGIPEDYAKAEYIVPHD